MITVNKYSVHSRLIALENFMTESLRAGTAGEIIALRAQVVALQSTVDALLAQNKKGSEYVEFLRAKVAARKKQ
jgi:hypothetical protein